MSFIKEYFFEILMSFLFLLIFVTLGVTIALKHELKMAELQTYENIAQIIADAFGDKP